MLTLQDNIQKLGNNIIIIFIIILGISLINEIYEFYIINKGKIDVTSINISTATKLITKILTIITLSVFLVKKTRAYAPCI